MDQKPEMTSADVVDLYTQLNQLGIELWVDGGWAVDALLEKQTRAHADLDIAIEESYLPKLREFLEKRGYKAIARDDTSKWNFVLGDGQGREIDVHAFVRDSKGNAVEGIMYPKESLTGTGTINGHTVRCISAKYMIEFLAPWLEKHPDKYLGAISVLCEKFDIDLPPEYKNFRRKKTS